MLVHLEFNLFQEANRLNLYEKYFDKASALGVTLEDFYQGVNIFLDNNPNLNFNEGYLKQPDFLEFCNIIKVSPQKLYDKYYRFVLNKNYSEIVLNCRHSLNLNQKDLSAQCKISPVTMGKLENKLKYPLRIQYLKLKEIIKL
ncbi:hypothetical protein [Clostridium tertium]|uniref:hypothetical protein n=1 Tax=Clostridium tertium TaxID=1559 RepID=UPI000DCF810F|nr:hypothetical protein [Clostridium tertium]